MRKRLLRPQSSAKIARVASSAQVTQFYAEKAVTSLECVRVPTDKRAAI